MLLGIKSSPARLADLDAVDADFTEVWFFYNDTHKYTELFTKLRQKFPASGLHYWGYTANGRVANMASANRDVRRESVDQIKKTIDIAAQNGFSYVNTHPGGRVDTTIDFTSLESHVVSAPISTDEAEKLFLDAAHTINEYAVNRGILFTVETVPPNIPNNMYRTHRRDDPKDMFELPIEAIQKAAALGIPVANDFGHTVAVCPSQNPEELWQYLLTKTELLAPQTRLIHAGFIIPPYNGTDCHESLANPIFDTPQAIPNRTQMQQLLQKFVDKKNIFALVEPQVDHVKNFHLLQDLVFEKK